MYRYQILIEYVGSNYRGWQIQKKGQTIRTYGQDTVLRVPKRNIDDRKFIKSIGSAVLKLQFDSEKMPIRDRDNYIIDQLSKMEKNGAF